MGRELNMDTQRQNFWKESIHKEATVRLSWHMKYSKEFARSSFPGQDHNKHTVNTNDIMRLMPVPRPTKPSSTKKNTAIPAIEGKHDEIHLDLQKSGQEMRPVTPETRKMLFKGFSAVGEGRYEYLQKRKQKKPEQKYEFPITSGWEYGWKITNSMKNSTTRPAEFGRTRIVKDSFYRTNGVMPIKMT